uniref:Uncharacterized protein n=1 Tax=Manihot esculenta TaxID=3983 RepID=A0A2C9V9Z1_MANES
MCGVSFFGFPYLCYLGLCYRKEERSQFLASLLKYLLIATVKLNIVKYNQKGKT